METADGVDPVADVAPVAIELGAYPVDEVRDLARDELLHVRGVGHDSPLTTNSGTHKMTHIVTHIFE